MLGKMDTNLTNRAYIVLINNWINYSNWFVCNHRHDTIEIPFVQTMNKCEWEVFHNLERDELIWYYRIADDISYSLWLPRNNLRLY